MPFKSKIAERAPAVKSSPFGGKTETGNNRKIQLKTMSTPEENFDELPLDLSPTPVSHGVYKTFVIAGNNIYVSAHRPYLSDGGSVSGRIGADVGIEAAVKAAEQNGLAILATLQAAPGSLDKIKRVVKILGMVNRREDFTEHPRFFNGCSELFARICGAENGVGVRSAVGMNSLPLNITVEIEAIFEI